MRKGCRFISKLLIRTCASETREQKYSHLEPHERKNNPERGERNRQWYVPSPKYAGRALGNYSNWHVKSPHNILHAQGQIQPLASSDVGRQDQATFFHCVKKPKPWSHFLPEGKLDVVASSFSSNRVAVEGVCNANNLIKFAKNCKIFYLFRKCIPCSFDQNLSGTET